MADDRSTPQGFISQTQAVGHVLPPVRTAAPPPTDSPPRGPRNLLLRRGENGYGFTLRHFIVYPPESCCMLPGHERTKIEEPMDTIFVRQVRTNSPASAAGLRTGDRVVSVDGVPTRGEQYASVVQRIQQAGPWLSLLVVSKEDDILQRYFGETAHNPETNQRPRLRSPERQSQRQRRSVGMIPNNSIARVRQSWVCSPPGSENQGTVPLHYGIRRDSPSFSEVANSSISSAPGALQRRPLDERTQRRSSPPTSGRKDPVEQNIRPQRFDMYDRTRPESVYSHSGSEQIYDKIKDPIYEKVRSETVAYVESPDRKRFPVSRAEPQVPIYRPDRRVVTRRASEGSGTTNVDSDVPSYGSSLGMGSSIDPGSRLSVDSKRDSSPASKDSLSSFDSNSTLTGNDCSDDSIMTRLRKSFEQKEEFLRRPSNPTGWNIPIDPYTLTPAGTIQREFYVIPQKLQKQIWPPDQQSRALRPVNQIQTQTEASSLPAIATKERSSGRENDASRDRFYSVSYDNNNGGVLKENHLTQSPTNGDDAQHRNSKAAKAPFIATLSRIHENVASVVRQQSQELRNGTASLPSSPGLDKKAQEKFPVPPQGLQIVSRRAKQFESGKLLSDDEETTSDRTNLYKSELSRLSNKHSVPNVAVRKREFESKAESQEPRRPAINRESKSLDTAEPPPMETETVRMRARSNSVESWVAITEPSRRSVRHTWQTDQEEVGDTPSTTGNKAKRQDSYLQAIRLQGAGLNSNSTTSNGVVLRRPKKDNDLNDEERVTRRISYLKATSGERMHVDSDLELSDSEPVQTLRRNSIASSNSSPNGAGTPRDTEPIEREGLLHVKFTVLDGKRSTDRSWKQVWGVLRGPILYFYKDRHSQTPSMTGDGDTVPNVDARSSLVDIAEDYTKRKNVLRVANPMAEVLLQSEDTGSMALWLRALQQVAAEKSSDASSTTSKQLAVPQAPGPNATSALNQGPRLSPIPSHKGIKKLTSFRNRSPTGQSPVNKTRKPSQVEPLSSPKTKTWKGRVAKQLRKMHGQAGSPSSPTAQLPPEGATFKVPLDICPQSSFSEYVPLLVEMCTRIVEARGLEIIGIYRVPGNTASISQLTESVNKGFENINLQDPRWSDVNVISSLLKSFFRQLPDSLLTADLYPMFIDADKIEDPQRRMATIRKLLRDLPEHNYETLKYLMFHLKRVVEHSESNKMEAKNLAIVFGPTLVRASGSMDNMVTMVTDMSHQCRIVESLLNNVDWFFSEDDLDDLSRLSVNLSLPTDCCDSDAANNSLLLNNIQKVEGMREMVTARDIVSSIISAANRKIQRRRKGTQDETDNEDRETDKSKPKAESQPVIRQSMALNERQCTVSEIVLMHESKGQSNHSPEHYDRSIKSKQGSGSSNNTSLTSVRTKYSMNQSSEQLNTPEMIKQQSFDAISSKDGPSSMDNTSSISNVSTISNETKHSNDEVAIRTYAGLSAATQERIRKFEQETNAMLHRDLPRRQREAEKREEDKRRIEMEWQLAKREMENDDILDSIVDTTVGPYLSERLTSLKERLGGDRSSLDLSERRQRSKSSSRNAQSGAVQQQPTARQKAQASSQLSNILGEKMNNGIIKKFKGDRDQTEASLLLPARYGSLDSLHEVHSPPSPMQQQRGVPGDISDDGSDLLTSLTSTFDRKWKSLVNHTPNQTISVSDQSITVEQTTPEVVAGETTVERNSIEVYRDPSLHKSPADKLRTYTVKNNAPEKDTDSSISTITSESIKNFEPDNDRIVSKSPGTSVLDATEKDVTPRKAEGIIATSTPIKQIKRCETSPSEGSSSEPAVELDMAEVSYSNKLKKFESLSQLNSPEPRSRLKRSESLNKKTETMACKLKRSESLNKHTTERPMSSPSNSKLKRSESLNKHSDRSESPSTKLKRSESLTKTEKTESNISKRRQSVRKESAAKLKRKNGMPERSIKRRHTVGGTKDFDKVHWLDNKLQNDSERIIKNDKPTKKSQLRTSSPDLSSNRYNMADASFLIEVSFRGPSNVVFNVTNARPQSLPDANLASKVFKVPLESHV